MSVEILSVSLSDDTVEALANAIVMRMRNTPELRGQATTESKPPSSQNPQGAERSGFQPEGRAPQNSGPWTSNEPDPSADAGPHPHSGQVQPQNDGPPTCKCGGAKRWVPPGFSKNTGKAYQGFWACPQPRGNQCPRD